MKLKNVGTYSVRIRLYEGESAVVKLIVKSEEDVKKEAAEAKAVEDKAKKEAEKEAKLAAEQKAEVAETETEE